MLVKDKEIIDLSSELVIGILQFKSWIDKRLIKLQFNLDHQISLNERFLTVVKKLEGNEEFAYKLAEEETMIEKERKELIDEFYANNQTELKKIFPKNTLFTELVKEYLTKG